MEEKCGWKALFAADFKKKQQVSDGFRRLSTAYWSKFSGGFRRVPTAYWPDFRRFPTVSDGRRKPSETAGNRRKPSIMYTASPVGSRRKYCSPTPSFPTAFSDGRRRLPTAADGFQPSEIPPPLVVFEYDIGLINTFLFDFGQIPSGFDLQML